ncbi:MAG: hypothetical protein PW788_07195 [Micavibrio sp.]|nr:hypothetical protein [Micavibrio sp.]
MSYCQHIIGNWNLNAPAPKALAAKGSSFVQKTETATKGDEPVLRLM